MPIGTRLGAYEVIAKLGEGGMGEVYRAHDTKLNRQVAIKILPDAYAADPERLARFHREAQAVAALNHSGIAAIYDLAEADGAKFLVLELIEGETLADRLTRGPIPVEEALTLAVQLLEALEFAHAKGVLHRDLKPANIKLTPEGTLKVLDFGLAKMLAPATPGGSAEGGARLSPAYSLTMSLPVSMQGMILGTAGYMSPEQAKGFEVDQRSDLFAVGCILYEMLTGRRAFEGDTASEILASVIKSDVDLARLPPRLHPRLIELLQRCLEKNPKKRYHAAADVRLEIERIIAQPVVEEPRVVVAPAPVRPLWRRALVPLASAIVAAAVVGYGVWRLKPEPPRTVGRFSVLMTEGQAFSNTSRRFLDISPDGRRIAYLTNNRLHVRELSALQSRTIGGDGITLLSNPVFSPDGEWIAYIAVDAGTVRLRRVAVAGGAPVTLCELNPPGGLGMRWTEEGIFVGQGGEGIVRVPAEGGSPTTIISAAAGEMLGSPEPLPGGRAIVYSVKKTAEVWDKADIVVQPLDGGARKRLVSGGTSGRFVDTGHLLYMTGGVLLAQRFDRSQLATVGGPVPVIEGVRRAVNPTSSGSVQLGISRSGTLVYVPGVVSSDAPGGNLAFFDRKGTNEPFKLAPGQYRAPRVSRDGRRVTFETEDEKEAVVWVYDLSGTRAMQRLTFEGKNRAPTWSPDGQWLAFQSDREGDLGIYRQRADGSGVAERMTTPESGVEHIPMDWSPDGVHLLLAVRSKDTYTLAMMTVSDRKLAPLRGIESSVLLNAMFSPDGRWIAYSTRVGATLRAFVEPFPVTGSKYLLPTTGGHPTWSPKGDEILMNTTPQQSAIVPVTTRPTLSFGQPVDFPRATRAEPNPGVARRNIDFMPDGQRIVGVLVPGATGGATSNEFVVVMNWFDELRQRVPP